MFGAPGLIWNQQQNKTLCVCVHVCVCLGGAWVTSVWASLMCDRPVKILAAKWFQFAQVIKLTAARSGHLWPTDSPTEAEANWEHWD